MPTGIEWADETVNPIMGCTKVSEGCKNCYAEKMSYRLALMQKKADASHPCGYSKVVDRSGHWNGVIAYDMTKLKKIDSINMVMPNRKLGWVITGAETGAGRRHADDEWFNNIRDSCALNMVPFFMKKRCTCKEMNCKKELSILTGTIVREYPNAMKHTLKVSGHTKRHS